MFNGADRSRFFAETIAYLSAAKSISRQLKKNNCRVGEADCNFIYAYYRAIYGLDCALRDDELLKRARIENLKRRYRGLQPICRRRRL